MQWMIKHRVVSLCLLALCILVVGFGVACSQYSHLVIKEPMDVKLGMKTPYQRLLLQGSAADLGAQRAATNPVLVKQFYEQFMAFGKKHSDMNEQELLDGGMKYYAMLDQFDQEELSAAAKTAGMKIEELVYLNMFYALVDHGIACRQYVVMPQRSKDKQMLHARNLDWFDYKGSPLRRNNLIIDHKPTEGARYLTFTWPGIYGVLTGTNEHGLTMGFNTLFEARDPRIGEPVFFTIKRALRSAKTVDEVVAMFKKTKPVGSGSVTISNWKTSNAVVIEMHHGEIAVREIEGHTICSANHTTWEADLRTTSRGHYRADWPAGVATDRLGFDKLGPLEMQKVMGSKEVIQYLNLLSIIFKPASNEMWVACGRFNAAEGEFVKMSIFEEPMAVAAERSKKK